MNHRRARCRYSSIVDPGLAWNRRRRSGERRNEGRELGESRCEEVVEWSGRDRHLPLQPDCLAGRGQALLHEAVEALLFVPDLDHPKAELGWSGEMKIDSRLRSSLDP